MKRILNQVLSGLLVFAVFALFRFLNTPTRVETDRTPTHRAAIIIDGDTLMARPLDGGEDVKVRLLRVDTPERGEEGFRQATDALANLVKHKEIALEYEGQETDEHGRALAYVWCEGRNTNIELVKTGWSAFFTRYGEGRYATEFRTAEREARVNRLGLWSEDYALGTRDRRAP